MTLAIDTSADAHLHEDIGSLGWLIRKILGLIRTALLRFDWRIFYAVSRMDQWLAFHWRLRYIQGINTRN